MLIALFMNNESLKEKFPVGNNPVALIIIAGLFKKAPSYKCCLMRKAVNTKFMK